METITNSSKIVNQNIDIFKLPEEAQHELVTFYEFLVFKYLGQQNTSRNKKHQILTTIFQEADGKLPANYSFNREKIHER